VTIALGASGELCAVDIDDSVEAVVAVCGTTTLGVGSEVAVDGAFTATSLVAPEPLFVPAGEEAGELGLLRSAFTTTGPPWAAESRAPQSCCPCSA
jgi:hypothetical protein